MSTGTNPHWCPKQVKFFHDSRLQRSRCQRTNVSRLGAHRHRRDSVRVRRREVQSFRPCNGEREFARCGPSTIAERLSGPFGRYDGLALIIVGMALVVVAAARFVRTGRLLDDQETHSAAGVRPEWILSAALALIVAACSAFLVHI